MFTFLLYKMLLKLTSTYYTLRSHLFFTIGCYYRYIRQRCGSKKFTIFIRNFRIFKNLQTKRSLLNSFTNHFCFMFFYHTQSLDSLINDYNKVRYKYKNTEKFRTTSTCRQIDEASLMAFFNA